MLMHVDAPFNPCVCELLAFYSFYPPPPMHISVQLLCDYVYSYSANKTVLMMYLAAIQSRKLQFQRNNGLWLK